MLILSFESSCDETSCAVVDMSDESRVIRSNIIASQISIHALYGGVVPEIASRAHCEAISSITDQALDKANITLDEIDAVAVTYTPGLVGALLVGVNFAKALAYSVGKPLVGVDHIKGHVAASYFLTPAPKPPFLAFVASGGHTSLIDVKSYTDFDTIGRTRDDAMGEAFDKVARVIGLGYPGGAEMDKLASVGDPKAIKFPSPAIPDDSLDFSFSGLKTAVINHVNTLKMKELSYNKADIAASFTYAITNSVINKLSSAVERTRRIKLVAAGGVSANSHLRASLKAFSIRNNISLYLPDLSLCGDNAAMIGAQAYYEYKAGKIADLRLNAVVN
ncbi:MAG: tRNA (adenosine(37)-N6)-threonylcarbamoyltransferase complex transferase subunit TsaD [Clostridiales bacterium]|nr:tRNA (adenosine(37)-N6)-threonylcarbamoyltransferase complex transferase subunit TsaD [Clostridiales bacterium]